MTITTTEAMNNKKRYAIVMAVCVILNLALYLAAHFFHLPLWMDMQGTALAAFVLEPTAGILVGLVQSMIESVFFYDASSVIYFTVSAAVAVIFGIMLKKNGKFSLSRLLPTLVTMVVVTSLISTLLSIWRSGGVPDSTWEKYFYQMALDGGVPKYISTFFGVMMLKIGDALEITVVGGLIYLLMPKVLKEEPQ